MATSNCVGEDIHINDRWSSEANIDAIRAYAIQQGLTMRATTDPKDTRVQNLAVTLTPLKFPTNLFQLACSIQPDINSLVDAISRDGHFLKKALERVIKTDEFTRRLFSIHKELVKDNRQTCVLGIHRSDYMVDHKPDLYPPLSLRQIEINTIAASFGGLSQDKVSALHRYVHNRYVKPREHLDLPSNSSLSDITDGFACAWKQYNKESSYVLFVVQPGERNAFDQRTHEFDLWNRYEIAVIRKTLMELSSEARLGPERELTVSGHEIAVVYYRAGYSPDDYQTEKEWHTRLLLERSRATCCPTATYQLVGTKKVQQVLAGEGVLERFVSDSAAAQRIRSTFAGLYSLVMDETGDKNVEMVLKNPERFVAKPQREGGGNNIYGKDVATLLRRIGSSSEREAYILMDRVLPPTHVGYILRSNSVGKIEPIPLIGELGVYGVYVRRGDEVLLNTQAGHMLRTKAATSDEGGVSVGVGALDTPTLVPDDEYLKLISSS